MLNIQNLRFGYDREPVLRGISFSLLPGRVTALLAPNGGGKTTLFRCLLGILRTYEGQIHLEGREIRTLPPSGLARRIAYVPQSHYPAFNYSVLDMVLMGTTPGLRLTGQPGEKEYEAARAAMEQLHISCLADRNYMKLSGGEQRMVLIARALAGRTSAIFLDEPTADLDLGNTHRVLSRMRALREQKLAILFSTHDPALAYRYSDSVLALDQGSLLKDGPPKEVITEEVLHRLYGISTALTPLLSGDLHISVLTNEEER